MRTICIAAAMLLTVACLVVAKDEGAGTSTTTITKGRLYHPRDMNPEMWVKSQEDAGSTDRRVELVKKRIVSQPLGLWITATDNVAHHFNQANGDTVVIVVGNEVHGNGSHRLVCEDIARDAAAGHKAMVIVGQYGVDRNVDHPSPKQLKEIREAVTALKGKDVICALNLTTWKNLLDTNVLDQVVATAKAAGLDEADAIALNVGKHDRLEDILKEAELLHQRTQKKVVISTAKCGRNDKGQYMLGPNPTLQPKLSPRHDFVLAYVWATVPGEDDTGTFNPDSIDLTAAPQK